MNFYVKGQTLTRAGKETIATEAVNFPNVEFTFDSSWDGVAGRTALFQNVNTIFNAVTPASAAGNTAYAVLLTSLGDGRYSCVVPHEVLEGEEAKKFIITVFGGSVNSKRITTNPVTCEVVPSMYDPGSTPGTPTPSLWDQIVDAIDDVETSLGNEIDAINDEIEDARIDTVGTVWDTLGNAIRGQVGGLKNYLEKSGMIASITYESGKRWVYNDPALVLVDTGDDAVSAVTATLLYSPTHAYIRTRDDGYSGQFSNWWGENSEEEVIQIGTNLASGQFVLNDILRGVVTIKFNCITARITNANVLCSNETYGIQYDEVVADTEAIDWIMNNVVTEELLGNLHANRWQTELTIDPPLLIGDMIHIVGTSTGGLPMAMKLYSSVSQQGIEQKFYDSQSSDDHIDIYVHVKLSVADTLRVWSKYGNAYNLNIYKVVFEGGASSLSDLSDTAITSPSNGQVLTYDSATSKWKNQAPSAGGHIYSDTEQVVGTAFGATVYEKTYLFTTSVAPNATIVLDANLDSGTASWVWLQNISLKDTSGDTYATENIRGIGTTVVSNGSGLCLTNNAGGITILMGIVTVRYIKVS